MKQPRPDAAQLLRLADLGLAGALRHFAEHSTGGAVEQHGDGAGFILFAGGHPYPGAYCNGVLRLDDAVDPRTVLDAAAAFFAPRRRGYAVWVRDHSDEDLAQAAQARGLFQRPPLEGMPGMVLCEQPAEAGAGGVQIERIAELRDAERYLLVVGEAYGMEGAPAELLAGVFFEPSSVLGQNVVAVLATVDGRPAAGAMTIIVDGVAGLYWAATAPWARGGGLGAACARQTTREGFQRGARMAALQASQMGTGMWRALGFEEITRYRRYLAAPARSR